ncbi:MAG: hypothetical protein UY15_C0026G0008 [Parcubacteria group bacterium GW2011_GWA2_47_9]|nr:MAG: hypothetical protein UY15_C0026G0008 [Parcubacteria group bacterium GW2011_GWA2_47_9]
MGDDSFFNFDILLFHFCAYSLIHLVAHLSIVAKEKADTRSHPHFFLGGGAHDCHRQPQRRPWGGQALTVSALATREGPHKPRISGAAHRPSVDGPFRPRCKSPEPTILLFSVIHFTKYTCQDVRWNTALTARDKYML